jgi:HEAT repeat protein
MSDPGNSGLPGAIEFNPDARLIGILTTDTELVVKSWDSTLERMTGIHAARARGRRLDDLVPDLRARVLVDLIREPLVSGSAQVLAPALHKFLIPCPPLEPSEEFDRMQQRVVVGALRDEERAVGLVVTIEDVTMRLEQERKLARHLRDTDPAVRLLAVRRLSTFEPTDGLGPLASAMADEDWQVRRSVVRALAARNDASLVDAIVTALRDGHRDFSLLSSALQLLSMTGVDVMDALVGLMRHPDVDLRVQAALALGTQRRPEAVTALLIALDDADANVQFHAIEALGKLAVPAAMERLADIAESNDFFLAFPAIEALVRIGDPLVLPRLAPLLSDPMLAVPAADALGRIGDEDAVGPLVQALDRPGAPILAVVDALASIHQRYQRLFSGASEIEDLVRRQLPPQGVQKILREIGTASGASLRHLVTVVGWLRDPAIPRTLARLLGSAEVHHEAIEAMVRFGSLAVELLIEQLDEDDADTAKAAAVALGRIGDRRAVPALSALLVEDRRELWIPVITALARLGDGRAFEPLLALLGDADAAVRQGAIGALNSIGHPEMGPRIRSMLDDTNPRVRESAVKIAGYFGYADCTDAVLERCGDADESVRSAALEHLPYFDDPRAIDALAAALASGTPRARAAAALGLGALPGANTPAILQRAVDDPDSWVRYFAVISLGRLGDPATLGTLGRVAGTDPAHQVSVAAVEAIGAIGGDEAVQILEPLIAADPGDRGHAAVRVLGRVRSSGSLKILKAALRSADPRRRTAAVEALAACDAEGAVEALQWTAAGDGDAAVARAALDGLGVKSAGPAPTGRQAVQAIVACLSEPGRRTETLTTLARLPPAAIPWLAEALAADDPQIRRGVVEALGRLSHPAASAYLQRALADGDAIVRRQAIAALSRIGTLGLTRQLSALANTDPAPAVRQAAAAALNRQGGGRAGANE